VNLAELAKLRYLDGWSRQKLAQHYGRTPNAITNYCQNIRKKDFNFMELTETEKEQIRIASSKTLITKKSSITQSVP